MKSRILYRLVEDLVFYSGNAPYARLKEAINRIDNDYFDDIQRDCEILPPELRPELRDRVIADFNQKISSLLNESLCDSIVAKVQNNTTLPVSDADITTLAEKLKTLGNSMQNCIVDLTNLDEEIYALYMEAKHRTLGERIMQSNKDDVIKFHHALQDNTERHVRQLVDIEIGKFLSKLADKIEHLKS